MKRILYILSFLCLYLYSWAEVTKDVPCGEWITIEAHPVADYHFVKWSDGNTDSVRSIQVHEDATYIAYFAANCLDYANWPIVSLYDWLLTINVQEINNQGYFFSPGDVTWYRVVGEPDDMHDVFPQDDRVVATGYYLTLAQNLTGTGDYYAVVDVADAQGRLCSGLMRTMIISYSGNAHTPQLALMPTIAKSDQTLKLVGLNPSEQTTIQVYSMTGQLLHTYTCEDMQFFFNAEKTAGCYLVNVSSASIKQTTKYFVRN